MSRNYRLNAAKQHWIYSREGVCNLYDVCDTTISNFLKEGLGAISGTRPQLFAGCELNRFQRWRRALQRRPPTDGTLRCPSCMDLRHPNSSSVSFFELPRERVRLRANCSVCDELIQEDHVGLVANRLKAQWRNTPRETADCGIGIPSRRVASSHPLIPPESNNFNQVVIFHYIEFCLENKGYSKKTIDEFLRALAKMSASLDAKPFTAYTKGDAIAFKNHLRQLAGEDSSEQRSWSTIAHTLNHCQLFFDWFLRESDGAKLHAHLPGYFKLSRREMSLSKIPKVRDTPKLEEVLDIHVAMGSETRCQRRNQAELSVAAVTGLRVDALVSLRGEDIDWEHKRLTQNPNHVRTKNSKHMSTWMISVHPLFFKTIEGWLEERHNLGLGPKDPLFPPDRYLNDDRLRNCAPRPIPCWATPHPFQKCMREACQNSKHADRNFTPHTLRGMIVVELLNTPMMARGLVALSKSLGHSDVSITLKAYTNMSNEEIGRAIAELNCDMPSSSDTDLDLVRAHHLHLIPLESSDYDRAYALMHRDTERLRAKFTGAESLSETRTDRCKSSVDLSKIAKSNAEVPF